MAINFPDTPNDGDIFTSNGKKWIYGGGKWSSYGLALAPDVLKVDSANNRVGVNNLSPSVDLDVTGDAAVSGSLTVDGDLTISGNTTTLNTTELFVEDNKVTLNSGATGSATANAGIEVERGDDPNVEILWDESVDAWKVATDFTVDAGTLHVDSANNRVGIGTTSPAATLTVTSSSAGTDNSVILQNFTGDASAISAARSLVLAADYDNNSGAGESYIAFETDTSERVRIDSSGNVGIGTDTPSEALDVRGDISLGVLGSNAGRLLLDNTTDAIQRISVSRGGSTGQLAFHTGADTEAVRITNSGNVGIGDTSPSYKLDVNGDINSQTDVLVSGASLPRGYVQDDDRTVSVGISTTPVTTLSQSVNVVAGRKYMLAWSGWTYATSTTMVINARIRIDGSTIQNVSVSASSSMDNANLAMSRIWEAPSTGSVTVDIQADTSTGTSFIRFTSGRVHSNWLMIDVGE